MGVDRAIEGDLRMGCDPKLKDFPYELNAGFLVDVARRAGQAIMEVYEGHEQDWGVQRKGDDSPLTKADLSANKVICDALSEAFPEIPITSEENKKVDWSVRKEYTYSWCVDPLDGTKEFLKRNGQFATLIALLKGSEAVLGLVQVPVTGQTYWAAKGRGAYVRDAQGKETRLRCREFDEKDEGLTIIVSRTHRGPKLEEFLSRYSNPKYIQLGSALKFTKICENEAQVYPRMAPTCEWDTAAPHVVLSEAGGEILQCGRCTGEGELLEPWEEALGRNQPVCYNKESDLNPFFIAYGRRKN